MIRRPLSDVLSVSLACLGACAQVAPPSKDAGALRAGGVAEREQLDRGAALFAVHCAGCHGERGRGDGPAAHLLAPRARDLGSGRFRIVSTENSVPSDADLFATLRRGMPGSAMPSFAWMSDDDTGALVAVVRELMIEEFARDLEAVESAEGRRLLPEEAVAQAREQLTAGSAVPVPAPTASGRALYERDCASCHGPDGRGRERSPRFNEDGSINWPRDFTIGVLKGGGSHVELVRRIHCGMPGSAMPAFDCEDPEDCASLVAFVQSLVQPGAADRFLQHPRVLVARRIQGPLPTDPADPQWDRVLETELVAAPLWWSPEAVQHPRVSAVHDGRDVSIRVRWSDPVRDDWALGGAPHVDAVAIQIARGPEPPPLGMGAPGQPSNLWHWMAAQPAELLGRLDLIEPVHKVLPGTGRDLAGEADAQGLVDAPLYVPAPQAEASSRIASGFEGHAPAISERRLVPSESRWADGGWEVVFSRSLEARGAREVSLEPGGPIHLAVAVWNGVAGDHGGRKSVTVWNQLVLAP
jgi:mono/diheme cytochrome c family protein